MKNLYLRSAAALACALGLAACGGSDNGTIPLQGGVSGVNKTGLVLQNNGGADLVIEPFATFFSFPELLGQNGDYNVTIKSSPPNASCQIINGKGRATVYGIGQISVACLLIPHNVSGKVTGNSTGDMVVINGADRITIPKGVSEFTMTKYGADGKAISGIVGDSQPYGIQVLTPPPGLTCSVANGTGTMGTTDVTNVLITCG